MWRLLRPDALTVFRDSKVRKVLGRYANIVEEKRYAKFLIAKTLPANYKQSDDTEKLWALHDDLTEQYYQLEKEVDSGRRKLGETKPEQSYLSLKVELANRILQSCNFCVRSCRVNRATGELGWCRVGRDFNLSTIFTHMGEEPELVPSGTVFTIGCNLRCLHCQNWSISQQYEKGEVFTPRMMTSAVEQLKSADCRNLNMVGGEPTPNLHRWLETLSLVKSNIATVWNSNSYYSEETAKLLAGLIDVYLLDFKYGNNRCAERISAAPKYWETCTTNHLHARKYGELIIRVLVLPEHNKCCTRPTLRWIAENLGTDVRINLMDQFKPEWRAHEVSEFSRRLTREEFSEAVHIAREVGLTNFIT